MEEDVGPRWAEVPSLQFAQLATGITKNISYHQRTGAVNQHITLG